MKKNKFDPLGLNVPWIDSPFFEQHLENLKPSKELEGLARNFRENGFLILDKEYFEQNLIDSVIADLQDRYQDSQTGYPEKKGRCLDAWKFSENVKGLSCSNKVFELLSFLYQRDVVPFQTLNMEHGTQQKAHSDTIHFSSVPFGFMCGVWVALEDVDTDNGPLFYIEKSHKLGFYDMFDIGLPSNWDLHREYEAFVEQLVDSSGLKKVEIHLEKGQGVLWSANLLHGGCKVKDPNRTRHSQVTHYYFSDCMYYSPGGSDPYGGHMVLKKVVDISTGKTAPSFYRGKKLSVFRTKSLGVLSKLFR